MNFPRAYFSLLTIGDAFVAIGGVTNDGYTAEVEVYFNFTKTWKRQDSDLNLDTARSNFATLLLPLSTTTKVDPGTTTTTKPTTATATTTTTTPVTETPSCPPGYTFHVGDVPTCGTISTDSSITDIASCAAKCDDDSTFCSFEYSLTATDCNCNLNRECNPTNAVAHEDYAFCVKETPSCPPGYTFHVGDVPHCGTISTDSSITDIASCAAKCDDD